MYSLYVHYMFTICSLYVHYMFTICSLYVHYMLTIYRLCIHHMFTIHSLHIHYMFTMCLRSLRLIHEDQALVRWLPRISARGVWAYSNSVWNVFFYAGYPIAEGLFESFLFMQTFIPHENHVDGFFLTHAQSPENINIDIHFCLIRMASNH